MPTYQPQTVLNAISTFLSYHDREEYDGVLILVRQRDGLFEAFTGGSADDPDFADDWAAAQFYVEGIFDTMANSAEPEGPQLRVITSDTHESREPQNDNPINMRTVWAEQLRQSPGNINNIESNLLDISNMKYLHPRPNEHGEMVMIYHASIPSVLDAFDDPTQQVTVVPDGEIPVQLNGISFKPWTSAPKTLADWVHVAGQSALEEPALQPKPGKKLSAGVVIIEPDGRFWAVAPTNAFGGYKATFPKGTIEPGMTPQATAIREAFEESGLQVEITGWIGDFERTTSVTRYYFAKRVSGNPAAMGWESQAVLLIPKEKLFKVLNHAKDHELLNIMLAKL